MMQSLWKRALSACLVICLALSLSITSFGAEEASLELSKTAESLNAQQETTVTLSIGADQSQTSSDVVFVLDKSTSLDVIEEALAMLSELSKRAESHKIKVGVVIFNRQANRVLELTELGPNTYSMIEEAMKTRFSSGTNIQAGLLAGREMLDRDEETKAKDKHLVLVSDGVAYLWGQEPLTIYSEIDSTNEECIYAGNEMSLYQKHHSDLADYYEALSDVASWMKTYGTLMEETAALYGESYETGLYRLSAYPEGYPKNYVPASELSHRGNANDLALYMAAKEYEQAAEAGYQLYAFGSTRYAEEYAFGHIFMTGLSSLGGISRSYEAGSANVAGMFDAVESRILYQIQQGAVTDVIGNCFDLVEGSFSMTVDGKLLPVTKDPKNDKVFFFGEADEAGKYPYQAVYVPEGEQFVWTILVPVEKAVPLTLSYRLKLTDMETEPGTYTVPTNEKAELYYTSTDGTEGWEVFEKPEVTYTVEDKELTEAPETGDSALTAWYLAAAAAALAAAGFSGKKKIEK